jgi:hypothetical protein
MMIMYVDRNPERIGVVASTGLDTIVINDGMNYDTSFKPKGAILFRSYSNKMDKLRRELVYEGISIEERTA